MKSIIDIEKLDLYYESFHALKNVNLQIPEKQVTAFIGPSGCGKSTLLRTLNRMNDMIPGTRIEGTVNIGGKNIYSDEVEVESLRKQVGMVFQQPNPFPKSIYDNVAYGPRLHGIRSKSELDEIVEQSLRHSALWEEVKDFLKNLPLACPADSSNGCVLPELWQFSRISCSWMKQRLHWILCLRSR